MPAISDLLVFRVIKSLRKKHWLYIGIAFLGVLLIAGGVMFAVSMIGPSSPKILEQAQPQPEDVSKFVRSDRFSKLPEKQKVAFVEKLLDNEYYDDKYGTMFKDLPKDEAKRLGEQMRPVFVKVINKKLDEYFRMKKEDKLAFMDKFLDRMERGRKRYEDKMKAEGKDPNTPMQARGGDDKPSGPGGGKGPAEFMEKVSPKRRTQYMQFGLDMLARAKQRGMHLGPGPGK